MLQCVCCDESDLYVLVAQLQISGAAHHSEMLL